MDAESSVGYGFENAVPEEKTWLRVLKTLFHGVIFIYYLVLNSFGGVILFKTFTNDNELCQFMAKFSFALGTNWNVGFQTVFLFLALTHDIQEWRNKLETPTAKKVTYWRDVIYNGLVVPYTLFVTSMFWAIYVIDRELVFPSVFDSVVPWWFNHCVHTNVTIIVMVETLLTARRYPTDLKYELKLHTAIAVGYAVMYYTIYFITNRWLYNVFGIMNWWQICLYQLGIWTSTYFFYFVHFPINRLIHGEVEKPAVDNAQEKTQSNGTAIVEEENCQKNSEGDKFSVENWNLKYRSWKEKLENSRL